MSSSNKAIRVFAASAILSVWESVKTSVKGNPREPIGGNAPTESTGIPVEGVIAGAGDTSNGIHRRFKWLLLRMKESEVADQHR
tara:strand:+ start:45 stop:296 length:252 start_codon:yes stop_codon:yes gene_type:complete